jgi:C-terminal processing protease CtpA/Prc
MLTELLTIEKQYQLTLQTAQFYDKEGKSYLNKGIEPDTQVTDEDALSFLLKKIN